MANSRALCAKSSLSIKLLGLSTLLISSTVFAAGFQIQEQNVTYLGTAYSGTAAWAADASTNFYNPAGLTRIKDKQVVASGTLIWGNFDFNATRSNVPFVAGIPVSGDQSVDAGGLLNVPALHYAARLTDDWVFGFTVTAPFGLNTDYDDDTVMRYTATYSDLKTIDIIPSLAWKATDWLSVAAGPDFLFADASLDVKTSANGGAIAGDGFQKNRARDWAFGWHAGFLVDFNDDHSRVGLQYRSRFKVKAEGDSRSLSPAGSPSAGAFTTRQVQAEVTLPETVVLSAYHEITPCWAIMADVAWVRWSRFKELELRYNPQPAAPTPPLDTVTEENFQDTWRLALGANFTYSPQWQFRTGIAWDESPVEREFRTARIPDSNRIWLSLGAGYSFNECLHFDLGYSHLFFKDSALVDRGPTSIASGQPALNPGVVEGNYSSNANIFGIQVRYDFV